MPKVRDDSIAARIYSRRRSPTSPTRFYADFRDFAHVGGRQEGLIPAGSRWATTDAGEAEELALQRLADLEAVAREIPAESTPSLREFGPYVQRHLQKLAQARGAELRDEARRMGQEPTERRRAAKFQWLRAIQKHLERALKFFGEGRDLALITPGDCEDWVTFLQDYTTSQGRSLGSGSIHQHLNSLSKLYRRALSERLVSANPVAGIFERPKIQRAETPFLEVHEMGAILRHAFEAYKPVRGDRAILFFAQILATMALTGCREAEVLGLLVHDVDLERRVIHVRENRYRGLKSKKSCRHVSVPSQLEPILKAYLHGPHAPEGDLLFPGTDRGGNLAMIHDLRKAYDRMPMPQRRLPGVALRSKIIRHTWCAARLQTTDRGQPVSMYTVAEEMGHQNTDMIKRIYGHLGQVRHRGEEVRFPFPRP